MLAAVSQLADLALFILTVGVVGKRPTAPKVSAMICVVAAVDFGFIALVSAQAQTNPIDWYQQQLSESYAMFASALGFPAEGVDDLVAFVAGVSPAAYLVQASTYVFIGLCIRWVADRVRCKSDWSAFSNVDLSIWWLVPLLAGVSCYTVSLFLQDDAAYIAQLVAANLGMVSGIPLFVQGAAAGKGIMNRMGFSLALQVVLGILGILSGLFFIVVPLVGLVDFWANFRKLKREDEKPG